MVNSGRLCEQFVGQHLLYSQACYRAPELQYWIREAKSASAEVDYVISEGRDIIPVEVKAGKTGQLKSLHQLIREKHIQQAVRINLDKPSKFQESHKLPNGETIHYRLLSIPFYMIGRIRSLVGLGTGE